MSQNTQPFSFKKRDQKHVAFSQFSEEEKGYYLAGLIEGDGYVSYYQLTISFHRKDRIASENIIAGLGFGTISDPKKEQSSALIFRGKALERLIHLINGKFVGNFKINQLIESGCAKRFNINILPPTFQIDINSHWLCGFMDSDGHLSINIIKSNQFPKKKSLNVLVNFTQKKRLLLDLIASLFENQKVNRRPLKDGRISHAINFKSQQKMIFWMNYFNRFHLQSRKYWQFLKLKECFCLIQEKKHLTEVGGMKIKSLQTALRNISIPESSRQIKIPLSTITKRFSLTDFEMNLIDTLLKEEKQTYVAIAKKVGISRDLLYRYRKKKELYRSKPLQNKNFRRKAPYHFKDKFNL